VKWRLPHCAYCEEPIIEGDDFVQDFGSEGDYYMHTGCYADWKEDEGRPSGEEG
jgi:hypothetical protein